MNSQTRDIWFEANNVRSAFIYDMIINIKYLFVNINTII